MVTYVLLMLKAFYTRRTANYGVVELAPYAVSLEVYRAERASLPMRIAYFIFQFQPSANLGASCTS